MVATPQGAAPPPAPVEGERGRADARAQCRGCGADLAERGREGGQHAAPPGGGLACTPGPVAPLGLTRFATAGWGADERPLAAAPPTMGQEDTPKIASPPLHLRPRRKRLRRRTMGFANTPTRHARVMGLFINRDEFELVLCLC